jgi:hypothetical protein
MTFAVEDIVRVVEQPKNQIVGLVDEVGYIEEIQGEYANIQTMYPDGRRSGCGSVPLKCLAPEPGEQWKRAKEKIEAADAKYLAEAEAYSARWNDNLAKVAAKYRVSVETARAIHEELASFR